MVPLRSALVIGVCLGSCLGITAVAQTPPPAQAPVYSSADAPPSQQLTLTERADIFLARRDYQAAMGLMSNMVRHHQATPGIFNRMGMASQQLLQLRQAERYYKLAIKGQPTDADFVNNLGTVYYERRKYGTAVKQFTRAIKLDATKAPFFVNLGGAQFARKKYVPALAAYRSALLIDPDSLYPSSGTSPVVQDVSGSDTPRFHYALSRLYCSMGNVDEALHQFRQAFEQHYDGIKSSLRDPVFAPLRLRPEYQALMGIPPPRANG